jgi:hypothetical protein
MLIYILLHEKNRLSFVQLRNTIKRNKALTGEGILIRFTFPSENTSIKKIKQYYWHLVHSMKLYYKKV